MLIIIHKGPLQQLLFFFLDFFFNFLCGAILQVLPEFWASDMLPVVSEVADEAAAADWSLPVAGLQFAIDRVQMLRGVIGKSYDVLICWWVEW